MSPAEQLAGLTLDNEWVAEKRVEKTPSSTGGNFSQGYIVKSLKTGRAGYLKAMDLTKVFEQIGDGDLVSALRDMTTAYEFEREVCSRCNGSRLDRIVAAIGAGTVKVNPKDPFSSVPYLIFQLAEGDVRSQMDAADQFDVVWVMQCLHDIAVALRQLHGINIAHQDLKPSNVLVFAEEGSKVADLGRACIKGVTAPHEQATHAGDARYAPPEVWYGMIPQDWNQRRLGCDLYHLGSMAVFLFSRCSMTSLLWHEIDDQQRPGNWGGTYAEVLPYLRNSFDLAIRRFSTDVPPHLREELIPAVRQLCDPDPARRGHPLNSSESNKYNLERYVSLFDRLRRRAELEFWSKP